MKNRTFENKIKGPEPFIDALYDVEPDLFAHDWIKPTLRHTSPYNFIKDVSKNVGKNLSEIEATPENILRFLQFLNISEKIYLDYLEFFYNDKKEILPDSELTLLGFERLQKILNLIINKFEMELKTQTYTKKATKKVNKKLIPLYNQVKKQTQPIDIDPYRSVDIVNLYGAGQEYFERDYSHGFNKHIFATDKELIRDLRQTKGQNKTTGRTFSDKYTDPFELERHIYKHIDNYFKVINPLAIPKLIASSKSHLEQTISIPDIKGKAFKIDKNNQVVEYKCQNNRLKVVLILGFTTGQIFIETFYSPL
jgi:hypothetical protein